LLGQVLPIMKNGQCVGDLDPLALCGSGIVIGVAADGTWKEITPADLDMRKVAKDEQVRPGDIALLRARQALDEDTRLVGDVLRHQVTSSPARMIVVVELPKTPTGKIRKHVLRDRLGG
jgi:acyl-CoA synthetase (AMP-forming)/AMP-acid ligase II